MLRDGRLLDFLSGCVLLDLQVFGAEAHHSACNFEILDLCPWKETRSEEAIVPVWEVFLAAFNMISMELISPINVAAFAAALVGPPIVNTR